MQNRRGETASGWRAAFIYYDWVLFVDLAVRPASTALEKASESLTWVGKSIHIYKRISMHARCTCMNRIYIYIYIYIHTWLWPSIYPSAYILYILYIPYLAAASLNVSFRLKEKQTSHTTNNQPPQYNNDSSRMYMWTNHYKQFRKTRKVPIYQTSDTRTEAFYWEDARVAACWTDREGWEKERKSKRKKKG